MLRVITGRQGASGKFVRIVSIALSVSRWGIEAIMVAAKFGFTFFFVIVNFLINTYTLNLFIFQIKPVQSAAPFGNVFE